MELRKITILFMCVFSFSFANAQHVESSYSGQESREIKSLSSQEVDDYLSGHGMGKGFIYARKVRIRSVTCDKRKITEVQSYHDYY